MERAGIVLHRRAGGDVPIQWMRWSCQIAVCEPETRCQLRRRRRARCPRRSRERQSCRRACGSSTSPANAGSRRGRAARRAGTARRRSRAPRRRSRVRFVSSSLLPRSTTRTVTPGMRGEIDPRRREVVGRARARRGVRRRRRGAEDARSRSTSANGTTTRAATRRPARLPVRPTRGARPRSSRYRCGSSERIHRADPVIGARTDRREARTPGRRTISDAMGVRRPRSARATAREARRRARARRRPSWCSPPRPRSPTRCSLSESPAADSVVAELAEAGRAHVRRERRDLVRLDRSCSTRRPTRSTSARRTTRARPITRSRRALPHLANGAYVVTWRVISADSHPVHGAFTFIVGQLVGERGRSRGRARSEGRRQQDRRRAASRSRGRR